LKNFNIDKYKLECYDIEPLNKYIKKRNTLENPPNYNNKFIITNPPYLARNKTRNKILFNKYKVNDLYKCFIKEITTNIALGGIIIIPLNFWSSIRISDIKLRKLFLKVYNIIRLNIFEERVFNDTSYTVCSFQFEIKKKKQHHINTFIFPSKIKLKLKINKTNNYIIGGEIYKLPQSKYKITRITSKNKDKKNTNILLKCIDNNKSKQISLSYVSDDKIYIDETPHLSSRTYATLVIEPIISTNMQKKIVKEFNKYLSEKRKKYNSLFLTNYRESKDISRKRISFKLAYSIVSFILRRLANNF